MYGSQKPTLRSVRDQLVGDSIERRRLVEKLIQFVRQDEREKVLGIVGKAREQHATNDN